MTIGQWVEIQFDCVPLRTVPTIVVPDEASPKFRQLIERMQKAVTQHGTFNAYYLHRASCTFHLTNDANLGAVSFQFEGTVLTDDQDQATKLTDLRVELRQETCTWLTRPVVEWLQESVSQAVRVEFDRYIAQGDLSRVQERLRKLQESSDAAGGFLGMYL